MYWADMRRPQLEDCDKERIVVVPLGSMEQHGPHLPVITDTMLLSTVAERIEAELGDAVLMLPTLWLGSSDHHLDFAGAVSVSASLYSRVVRSVAESILKSGFRRILFLNGHGGNQNPAVGGLKELACESEAANSACIALAAYWELAEKSLKPELHGTQQATLSHAGEYETSMMLFVSPDLVEMAAARSFEPVFGDRWWHSETEGAVHVFKRMANLTHKGSMGLPDQATAGKGRTLIEAITREVVAFMRDFAGWPEIPKHYGHT